MKGADLVSTDKNIFSAARDALVAVGATQSFVEGKEVVELRDRRGRLFSLFAGYGDAYGLPLSEAGITLADGVQMPDLGLATDYPIECESEELLAAVMQLLAERVASPTWLLDADEVLWSTNNVDVSLLAL